MKNILSYNKVEIKKNFDNPECLFPTLRIIHVLRGAANWKIGNTVLRCEEGDIILFNNIIPRRIAAVLSKRNFEIGVYEFSPTIFAGGTELIKAFYNAERVCFRRSDRGDNRMEELLIAIKHELQTGDKYQDEYLFAALKMFLILAARAYKADDRNNAPSAYATAAMEAAIYIWSNYKSDIDVASVAKATNASRSNLSRNFKKVHGTGIAEYICLCRIYGVIDELSRSPGGGSLNILQVAFNHGFTSSSGFYKAFHRVTGMAPGEYI